MEQMDFSKLDFSKFNIEKLEDALDTCTECGLYSIAAKISKAIGAFHESDYWKNLQK